MSQEFSIRTREQSLRRFRDESFDLLVVGGGITGAAVARDAATRGLKVALVEKRDFAWGTSSRSSKLIHGGLRYLENFEFGLVFEALSERAFLLKSVPNLVRPLRFFLPVYKGDPHGKNVLSLGLWLYDLLALFRAPGFHKRLSAKKFSDAIPALRKEGLQGGFTYFDASMCDDVMTIETLRAAHQEGVVISNYAEATTPLWKGDQIAGFRVKDALRDGSKNVNSLEIELRATRTVICAGPWLDEFIGKFTPSWTPWLAPSKGVHLVFDLKRLPVPGALVMSHPTDGRISFVIPRADYGSGVVIVGTTDGPSPANPEKVGIEPADVDYLLRLLNQYFPDLKIDFSDILSAYIGVRPLMGGGTAAGEGQRLQKVSREHHIGAGPGGTVVVAGGKYTTHRRMASEIVDFVLEQWRSAALSGRASAIPGHIGPPRTSTPLNIFVLEDARQRCIDEAARMGKKIPPRIVERYGLEALELLELNDAARAAANPAPMPDPEGFPFLAEQLRFAIRRGMVVRLEDFYFRRTALFLSRADHGIPWIDRLAAVWAEETGASAEALKLEKTRLLAEIESREEWRARAQHERASQCDASDSAVLRHQ